MNPLLDCEGRYLERHLLVARLDGVERHRHSPPPGRPWRERLTRVLLALAFRLAPSLRGGPARTRQAARAGHP